MNIKEMLGKIRETNEALEQAERLLARNAHENFYISSSNGPCVYIKNEEVTPIIQNKIETLKATLKVLLDAQLTAERVIAGLLTNQ
ncbi:hypothetical protein [Yersinia kristensenii]|uniref:hypothetical protein n=1 Tax=Yersinia kristensenii TaxID=28152 RepID=UPI001C60A42F|nr:hypothetical protein [Yersinia kristensenii]